MYKSMYDTDVITWSPQGRIFQMEYAMEAIKQGTVVVGLRSDKYAILAAHKRSQSELAEHQKKLFKVDDHLGMGISGLTADARILCEYMRTECLNHKFVYGENHQVGRLVVNIGDKAQQKTQRASSRPYGVALLVAGYDEAGPHIYESCPSGSFHEYFAMAIGGRSQSAKTYLEKNFESFKSLGQQELLKHAVKALHASMAMDTEMTTKNIALAVVGPDQPFKELSEDELKPFVDEITSIEATTGDGAAMETS